MKYGILITDLTAAEAQNLLATVSIGAGGAGAIITQADEESDEGVADGSTIDASGLPWDARIHASTKTKTSKGVWKKLKGVQPVTVETVEAELRAQAAAAPYMTPVAPTAPVAPAAPMAPALNAIVNAAPAAPVAPVMAAPSHYIGTPGAPTQPVAPVAAPAAPIAPAVPAAPVAPTRDFNGLMTQISNLYKSGRETDPNYPQTIVNRINSGFKITTVINIADIAGVPEYVEYAWKCLEVDNKAA